MISCSDYLYIFYKLVELDEEFSTMCVFLALCTFAIDDSVDPAGVLFAVTVGWFSAQVDSSFVPGALLSNQP